MFGVKRNINNFSELSNKVISTIVNLNSFDTTLAALIDVLNEFNSVDSNYNSSKKCMALINDIVIIRNKLKINLPILEELEKHIETRLDQLSRSSDSQGKEASYHGDNSIGNPIIRP